MTTTQSSDTGSKPRTNDFYSLGKRKAKALTDEYHYKVSHDFSRYVFFGKSSLHNENMDHAIDLITSCHGYEAHRMIHFKGQTTHFYIKFVNSVYAEQAVIRIRQVKCDYVADIVDSMLVAWYLLEMTSGSFPWTLAVVDTVGRVEHANALSPEVLRDILVHFGDPRIHSYGNGIHQVSHAQVMFSSMSEALGASIAFGCWYRNMDPIKTRFYYSVKILSSEKEISLLKTCVDQPLDKMDDDMDALELDYFLPKVTNITADVSYSNQNMLFQDANTIYVPQVEVPESLPNRSRTIRRQFSRGRGNNPRNRNKGAEAYRGPRPMARNLETIAGSTHSRSSEVISNDFISGMQLVP
ncbi:uncharacterized protein NPIL_447521 [Nephila pilipes]|uniref:Uncharacterized protein n=1 Tax=Nephila pilipes TaxID=299642 RepID=A0A8X6PFJ3_NEPPI|nr:uncharacterized protein NPIL_447521 [Nephila pilipes]